jgi:hypothetical protein
MGLGSGIRDPDPEKPIPDPGSRGQKKGTGSRIPDPHPQHCSKGRLFLKIDLLAGVSLSEVPCGGKAFL